MSHTPNASPLDNLLRQSLFALARSTASENDANVHLLIVLTRITRYFRSCTEVLAQCVIELGSTPVEIEGRPILCPRLLVQCTRRDFITPRPLTLTYLPVRIDRINLRVGCGDTIHEATDFMQCSSSRSVWCISGTSDELHGESHAHFLRRALYEAGLFCAQTMTLEPLRG